jgi:hypothetical protein
MSLPVFKHILAYKNFILQNREQVSLSLGLWFKNSVQLILSIR